MTPKLRARPRQRAAVTELVQLAQNGHRRLLLQAPTGFGKTFVIGDLVRRHLLTDGNRVLVIVHRRELARQTVASLRHVAIEADVVQAEGTTDTGARVVVASLQTLAARGIRPTATLVVWDECHHCPAQTFLAIFADYEHAMHVGTTATPERADGRALGDMFHRMVVGATVKQLTDEGLLVPSEVLCLGEPTRDLAIDPVDAYQRYTPGRSAVVFAASVAHARALAESFTARGIKAACVDGETDAAVRDDVLEQFAVGELDVLTNCFVLTEGWDCPRADVAILCRSFDHVGVYLQCVGRILRNHPSKKIATVLDLRGAALIHGLPDESRTWRLTGKPCIRTESMTALRRCKECFAIFRPTTRCPRCGATNEVVETVPRVLRRVEILERLNDVPLAERDRRYMLRLISIGKQLRHMNPTRAHAWALSSFEKRFGRKPGAAS